jgi:hypothetical protein
VTVTLTLASSDYELAVLLAEETFKAYEGKRGFYGNSLDRHLVGKLGEVALDRYLIARSLVTDPAYADRSRESQADILTAGARIEVKTWQARYWPGLGRCVAVGQLPSIRRKADLVAWLSVANVKDPASAIVFHGWSTIDEIAAAPIRYTGQQQVENHQVEDESLRPPRELMTLLSDASEARS